MASSKFAGQASKLEPQGSGDVADLNLKTVWRQNSFLSGIPQSFLLRPLVNWVRSTHIMKAKPLHSKSTGLSHLKNTFTAISRQMFDQATGHYSLATLTPKLNHLSSNLACSSVQELHTSFITRNETTSVPIFQESLLNFP